MGGKIVVMAGGTVTTGSASRGVGRNGTRRDRDRRADERGSNARLPGGDLEVVAADFTADCDEGELRRGIDAAAALLTDMGI